MNKPKLWIARKLSDATLERAQRDYDTIINTDDGLSTADEIVAMSAEVDAIIPCHSELFDADVAQRLDPRLKIIANHSVGVDHCDLPSPEVARHRGYKYARRAVRCHRGNRHAADARCGAARC